MTETPDNWVIVDLNRIKKILCSWSGGYLGADEWRLSSGVVHAVDFGDRYGIVNASGSLYVCYKTRQKVSSIMQSQINNWQSTFGAQGLVLKIIDMPSEEIETSVYYGN